MLLLERIFHRLPTSELPLGLLHLMLMLLAEVAPDTAFALAAPALDQSSHASLVVACGRRSAMHIRWLICLRRPSRQESIRAGRRLHHNGDFLFSSLPWRAQHALRFLRSLRLRLDRTSYPQVMYRRKPFNRSPYHLEAPFPTGKKSEQEVMSPHASV